MQKLNIKVRHLECLSEWPSSYLCSCFRSPGH